MNTTNFKNDILHSFKSCSSPPIILCLGNSRFTCDIFAPLVGELLTKKYNIKTLVLGNLTNNVTAKNFIDFNNAVKINFPYKKIFVIDSSFSYLESFGKLKFLNCGIKPGQAIGFQSKSVGDFSLLANINILSVVNNKISSFTRAYIAENLAITSSKLIYDCFNSSF